MKFSLQHHLKDLNVDLTGRRLETFKRALECEVQKRDILWLKRLSYVVTPASVSVPHGWSTMTTEFHDMAPRKNEKSVFYFLQHALYSGAFYIKVKNGETLVLPRFPANYWPFLMIHVEAGAQVTLVDDHGFDATEATPFRSVMVFVGAGAQVRWTGYQHHAAAVSSFDHKWFYLEEASRLQLYHHVVGGLNSFDETVVELVGRGASVHSQVVFFGHETQQQEMRVNHVHVGQDTVSNMISKGAVKDTAHGGFIGNIQMEPGCSGANGNLEEHNLLLTPGSKIDAIPGLEIGHHDVAAAHAAYMEKVDDEKLFYLAARGIPQDEAIRLIVEGFFSDAIERMKSPEMEVRIFNQILSTL